jgi:hypothetical protein
LSRFGLEDSLFSQHVLDATRRGLASSIGSQTTPTMLAGTGAMKMENEHMRAFLKKTAAISLSALILAAGALGASTPASAATWRGGGWHGGVWHGGWRGGRYWGWGPGVALGALAVGAAIASAPYYYPYYPYAYNGCVSYQPVYDQWGRYIGQQPVNMCR